MAHQVITLCLATSKFFVKTEPAKIKEYQGEVLNFFDTSYPEIIKELEEKKVLTDELKEKIMDAAEKFVSGR